MRRVILALSFVMVLAGCREDTPLPDLGDPDACGASGLQTLVGQSRDVLAAMTFAAPMRVIGPGEAVSMDYRPNRLNVEHDAEGVIERVTCG